MQFRVLDIVKAPDCKPQMRRSESSGTRIGGYWGLSACRITPALVIRSRLMVISPSRIATTMDPSVGSNALFTMSSSPSLMPPRSMESRHTRTMKVLVLPLMIQVFVQVDPAIEVVLGRRRVAGGDRYRCQQHRHHRKSRINHAGAHYHANNTPLFKRIFEAEHVRADGF